MARFKPVPKNFLFRKLLNFWGNMVKNYCYDCRDDDFFDVVRNCFDHDRAVELIELAYTPEWLLLLPADGCADRGTEEDARLQGY